MKCDSCGANSSPEANFCQHCGAAVKLSGDLSQSRARIFEQIKASPQFQQAQSPARLTQLPKPSGVPKTLTTIFSMLVAGKLAMLAASWIVLPIGLIALFAYISSVGQTYDYDDPRALIASMENGSQRIYHFLLYLIPCMLVSFLVISVILGLIVRWFSGKIFPSVSPNLDTLAKAPVEVHPAIAITKRTQPSGAHSASTRCFVTFELEDGQRKEYALWYGTMDGRIAADDAGVLFTRGEYAADFDQIAPSADQN